ncbi:SPOR domain-containing protein [Dasania marina]|uniref:SPOR domain-containing protein n=1 Tax=Dasania marina TaxID=471499 RepID=UPI00037EC2BE|nr:SPOR domain-containing protein [Dasania marina]
MLSPKKSVNTFTEHYVYRLDLGVDPFAENFRPSFFYPGGERRKVLEQLVHYSRFSKQPVLLCGDSGSGKKSLLQEVLEQLQAVMDCCRIDVAALLDQEAILAALADRLGLKLDDNYSLVSFNNALKFTVLSDDEPEPILIIVENIQLLEQAEISLLQEIHQAAQGGIHLLLVSSETENASKHQYMQQQQAIKIVALRPLSQQESVEYLQLLLQSVGYAGEFPLSDKLINKLHESAQGNFAAMGQLMPTLLMHNDALSVNNTGLGVPITHVGAITILAVAIAIAYFYRGEEFVPGKPNTQVTAPQAVTETQPKPEATSPPQQSVSVSRDEAKAAVVAGKTPAHDGARDLNAEPAVPRASKALETPVVVQPSKELPLTTSAPVVKAKAKTVTQSTASNTLGAREQRLLDMPANAYMLQLLGSRKEQSAKDFIAPYQRQLAITYIATSLKGQPWYVVLAGPYDDRAQALAAMAQLPQALQRQKPWARSLSGIQADLRNKTDE